MGAQYYRPPFPRSAAWADDLRRARAAGLDTIVCWVVWGWCEPAPGRYVFDDYDRLLDLAEANGLQVVLSVLPEVNPFWVPRELPDARMIDVFGRPAANGARLECLSGLVPGGCTDHPQVRALMERFLESCGRHFAARTNLRAWDVWNENRWRNGVDESVCFCSHSLASLRRFLGHRYGSLEALGNAWGRRYVEWEDVRIGPPQAHCYPEMHDFLEWLTHRNQQMIRWRIDAVRRGDPTHPIGSHTSAPSVCGGVALKEDVFARGVDWDVAQGDFYGLSLFPDLNGPIDPIDIAARYSAAASAATDRPCYLSELQGGPVVTAGEQSPPLEPRRQQAWVWLAVSRGLRAAIYWCWRPEVFGQETGGYGLLTPDGLADQRLTMVQATAQELAEAGLDEQPFSPAPPRVAVLFQRDAYWLDWMRSRGYAPRLYQASDDLWAYLRALELLHVPYVVLDDRHADQWRHYDTLRLIIVPDSTTVADDAAAELLAFTRQGGAVFIENVPGRIGPDTFERAASTTPIMQALNAKQLFHRRVRTHVRAIPEESLGNHEPIEVRIGAHETGLCSLDAHHFTLSPGSSPTGLTRRLGRGRIALIGSTIGGPTYRNAPGQLVELLVSLLEWAGTKPPLSIRGATSGWCTGRLGSIGSRQSLLLINFGASQSLDVSWEALDWTHTLLHDTTGNTVPVRVEKGRARVSLNLEQFGHKLLMTTAPHDAPQRSTFGLEVHTRPGVGLRRGVRSS